MNGRTNSTPVETENLEIPLEQPTNLTADPGNGLVTLKWTDPENKYAVVIGDTAEETDQLVSEFDHSVVVRKNNSDPIDPSDGTVVTTATKNQYQSTGYIDSNLPNDIEYHYGVYAINKAGIPSSGIYAHTTPMSYRAASTFPVGSIFKMNISGEPWEFIVVQQGNPDTSKYSSNCNGTWLLMKNIYTEIEFDITGNYTNFPDSTIYDYLHTDLLPSFDSVYRNLIKTITIPYCTTNRSGRFDERTASCRMFVLSTIELGIDYDELGYPTWDNCNEGTILQYFQGTNPSGADPKRIAYYNNKAEYYVTRTATRATDAYAAVITQTGLDFSSAPVDQAYGVRPAMIIDSNAMFNDNGELLIT